MSVGHWLGATAQLLWPARCAACDAYVPEAAVFCEHCQVSLGELGDVCSGCALPSALRERTGGAIRCFRCRQVPFPFTQARAVFPYGEAIAEAIVRMKHGARRDLARRLGRLMGPTLARAIAAAGLAPGDVIIPVPLHPRRLRRRGFNQALELVRGALGVWPGADAALARPRIQIDQLRRVRPTRELGHAGPAARLAEVAGAFAVAEPEALRGSRVLLVDDVFTTGATFTACAEALRQAGAAQVHVLALARAV
ncbi:MAG TPA: ComF family protein [Polyangia bacterium]|nr:ComF family protein [Polyangia bacterium]